MSGIVPLVTRKLEMPRLWSSSMSSGSFGYRVGSPVSEIAKWLGLVLSLYLCCDACGFPLNPLRRSCHEAMQPSMMSFGSSIGPFHFG